MKKLMPLSALALTVLMTACGGPSTPSAVTSVSGTVVEDVTPDTEYNLKTGAWTGDAGSVVGYITTVENPTPRNLGTLDANGSFKATLPATVEAGLLVPFTSSSFSNSCDKQLTLNNTTTKIAPMVLTVDANKDGDIAPLLYSGSLSETNQTLDLKSSSGGLVYADQAVSITGTQNCTTTVDGISASIKVTASVNLVKGWNLTQTVTQIHLDGNTEKVTGTVTLSSGKLPTDKWVYAPFQNAASLNVSKSKAIILRDLQNALKPTLW